MFAIDRDGSFESLDGFTDNVHADASAGDIGQFIRGAETGEKDQRSHFFLGQFLILFDHAAIHGQLSDFCQVQSATVIGDANGNLRALVEGFDLKGRFLRFAGGLTCFGRFNAVIQGVADQVQQRIGDLFQHGFIKFGAFAFDDQIDFLSKFIGDAADGPVQTVDDVADGNHADVHEVILSVARQTLLATQQRIKVAVQRSEFTSDHRDIIGRFRERSGQQVEFGVAIKFEAVQRIRFPTGQRRFAESAAGTASAAAECFDAVPCFHIVGHRAES